MIPEGVVAEVVEVEAAVGAQVAASVQQERRLWEQDVYEDRERQFGCLVGKELGTCDETSSGDING